MAPAGDPTAVLEIITWSAIRPGNDYGTQQAKNDTLYLYGDAEYMLSDSWSVTLSNAFGHSRSYTNSDGPLCTRCVYEELNGTTAASGALSRPNHMPLTTVTALDVWQCSEGRRVGKGVASWGVYGGVPFHYKK